MDKTFNELFDDFFNKNPSESGKSNKMIDDARKMIEMMMRFQNTGEISKHW